MVREGARIARAIESAVGGIEDPVTAFAESFVVALRVAREHPFISWASLHEPAELLHAGAADDAAMLRLGTALIAGRIRELQAAGVGVHLDPDAIGETIARLFAMLLLLPTQVSIDVSTDSAARDYAYGLLLPLLTLQPRDA